MTDEGSRENSGVLLTVLVTLLYAAAGIFAYKTYFIPGYRDIQKARCEISELQQEIQTYRRDNEQLVLKIRALKKNDPAAWEEATRKYLGWVKPGEIIIDSK